MQSGQRWGNREHMDDPLRIIAAHEGVFLRSEAIGMGYDDNSLRQSLHAGVIVRVRHGCYCFADVWRASSRVQKHLILARAVARTTPGAFAFSHTTALLLHGVAVCGADLTRVDVTVSTRVLPDFRRMFIIMSGSSLRRM